MISVLRAEYADTARVIKFAEAWSGIKHPNILPVTEYGASGDNKYLYVISEYPGGDAFTTIIDQKGTIASDVAVQVFLQLCEALGAVGKAGLVHGNCMPAHTFHVAGSDTPHHVRLSCSAALTRFVSPAPAAVSEGEGGDELSPLSLGLEFIKRGEVADATTEVYTLGTVMYGALTGLPPFTGKTFEELKQSHLEAQPLSLRGVAPDVEIPVLMDKLVLKALKKEKSQRQASVDALKQELLIAAEKSRIYLPTYVNARYTAQQYTGDTGAYETQQSTQGFLQGQPSGAPPSSAPTSEKAERLPDGLAPETRGELESKVKDLRSHVYLVTSIAVIVLVAFAALLSFEGPAEDHAPNWKKLHWMMTMYGADQALDSKDFDKARQGFLDAQRIASEIQDGGDRRTKTLRKLRTAYESLHDKKEAEKTREEIIRYDQHQLERDEAPVQ